MITSIQKMRGDCLEERDKRFQAKRAFESHSIITENVVGYS